MSDFSAIFYAIKIFKILFFQSHRVTLDRYAGRRAQWYASSHGWPSAGPLQADHRCAGTP